MSNFKHSNVIIFVFLIFDFQIQIYSMDFEKDANTYYNSQTNLDIEVGTPVSKFYDKNGPLHCAVMYNHIVTVEKIACHMDNNIDIKNIRNQTPLHIACIKNNLEAAIILLNYHAYINSQDSDEKTPIYHATENNSFDICNLLISWGAKINIPDIWGNTPLHIALKKGFDVIAKLLISNRADINFTNKNGKNPLDMLIKTTFDNNEKEIIYFDEKNIMIARTLLVLGAQSSKYETDYLKLLAQDKEKHIAEIGYFEDCEIV